MYIYIAEVHLYTQVHPYDDNTKAEFDPDLGRHDAFLMVDRYIFVQVRNYHLSINISIYLSIYMYLSILYVCMYPYSYQLLIYIFNSSVHLLYIPIYSSINDSFIHPSIHLYVSIYPPVHSFIYLFIHSSIHPSITSENSQFRDYIVGKRRQETF